MPKLGIFNKSLKVKLHFDEASINKKIAEKTSYASYIKYVNHSSGSGKTIPGIELDLDALKKAHHFDIPRNQLPNGDPFPGYVDGEDPVAVIQLDFQKKDIREQNFYLYLSSGQLALFIPSFHRLKCRLICVDGEWQFYNSSDGSVAGVVSLIYAKSGNPGDKGGLLLTAAFPRQMSYELEKILTWVD